LVPSTSRKTAVFSSIAVLGVMVSTWLQYQGHRPHPDAPGPGAYVIIAGVLGLATVLITSLTSRTIFGLRQRVREASELGQYTLLERIGEGGMGIVYKARHAMLRRPTAIKLLPAERAGEHNLQRFEREVQLTSLLTHPNTVSVFDYGRTADGVLYYAMEYLDGVDLDALVSYDGPQEPGRVVHLLRQICGALGEAHAVGLVHRDVKPANVLLCSRGGSPDLVKVLDFGLVKSVSSRGDASVSTTAIDQIVGTPLYMSPEAITSPEKVDARSDLYALGALGYFLLVGEPPFSGQSAVEVCGHHLHSPPVPPFQRLGKPSQTLLDQVILRCLQKAPDARFQCALDLERALDACNDAPAWTAQQAAEWWRQHEPELKARRTQPEPAVSGTDRGQQTVAVDWRLRAG
jgi:serine/threonine-protein kinase